MRSRLPAIVLSKSSGQVRELRTSDGPLDDQPVCIAEEDL